jgi:hypothetical protein
VSTTEASPHVARRPLESAALFLAALVFWSACLLSPLRPPSPKGTAVATPHWLLALDDAYVFVRYAEQAARGLPLQWSPGELSTGASSPLYAALLVPVHWASQSLAVWSWWSRGIGLLSLWFLGLAAAAMLRAAGLPDPWPLAAGVAVVWSGPVGFGAVAGMESAANAGLVLFTCAAWSAASCQAHRSWGARWRRPLVLASLLPLLRPENAFLTLLAVAAAMAGPGPRRRWKAALALLPGLALAVTNLLATGAVMPTGATAKSWLGAPFVPLGALARQVVLNIRGQMLPIYAGRTSALWFPAGPIAIATALAALLFGIPALRRERPSPAAAGSRRFLAGLTPLAAAWMVLFLSAPLSAVLLWQQMRHHHAGLACAWALAVAGIAIVVESLAARRAAGLSSRQRSLALLLPLPLLFALPHWAREHQAAATDLFRRNGPAAAWLSRDEKGRELLLNDAGLLAIAHDGPMTDVMGLGTPDLTLAYRHGPGAIAEALARRRPLPEIAAVNLQLVKLPEILGRPLLLGRAPDETIVAEVRRELLAGTPLAGRGVDFAFLPDERRVHLRWVLPPGDREPSFALLLPAPDGAPSLQGCRPLYGRVGLEVPAGVGAIEWRAALLAGEEGEIRAQAGAGKDATPLGRLTVRRTAWNAVRAAWPRGASRLWLAREGAGLPCLEAVRFF